MSAEVERKREINLIWGYDKELAEVLEGTRMPVARLRTIRLRIQEWYQRVEYHRGEAARGWETARDLRVHLRDRDAHIKNLEAQLMPYIGREEVAGDQEAML